MDLHIILQTLFTVVFRMNTFLNKHKKGLVSFVKLIVFIIVFAILFINISYMLRPSENETKGIEEFYTQKENSMDVVYIGGSVCIVSWMPYTAWESNGIPSYSFGKSSLMANSVKYMIKEVEKSQSPELYVIDLRPFQYTQDKFDGEPMRALANTMPYSLNRISMIYNSMDHINNIANKLDKASYYVDMLLYHQLTDNLRLNLFSGKNDKNITNESKGFLFIDKHDEISLPDNSAIKKEMAVSKNAEECLKDVMNYLKNTNKKALFVVSPYQESEIDREQYNYLKRIIIDNGFDYLNANDYIYELSIDYKRDFYDFAHMNIFGAEKYTKYLSNYIAKKYNLEDKRKKTEYADWNNNLLGWKQQESIHKNNIENIIPKQK